jgi:hypothetical protein
MEPFARFIHLGIQTPCPQTRNFKQVTASPRFDATLTARIQLGPLSGLSGSVVATTPQGKTYLQLHHLPGVTVLIPSHLLQPAAAAGKQAN